MEVGLPNAMGFIYYDSRCIYYLFQTEEMVVKFHSILFLLTHVPQKK